MKDFCKFFPRKKEASASRIVSALMALASVGVIFAGMAILISVLVTTRASARFPRNPLVSTTAARKKEASASRIVSALMARASVGVIFAGTAILV